MSAISALSLVRRRRIKKRFSTRLLASQQATEDRPGDRPPAPAPRPAPRPAKRPAPRPAKRPAPRPVTRHLTQQVTHHVLRLDDGQRVGVAVAGAGVPFLLLHGIGLHNRTYERCLSYLPELGFLAVAIEAPGHGQSSPAAREADFTTRVDLLRRAVDALGIRRAVVAGHSMGGRSAACFAALNPRRVLAAVFIDAALGENWDNALIKQLGSEVAVVRGLVDGIIDTAGDTRNITWSERLAYYRMLSGPGRPRLADVARTPGVARAIAVAESDQWLAAIRSAAVPAVVLHGARDLVIPLPEARAVARRLDAPLLTVPRGYHSWLLASPRTFAAAMAAIFAEGAPLPRSPASCFDPGALVLQWRARPSSPLPPWPDQTVLEWQIEAGSDSGEVSGTGRLGFAKAVDTAAGWARNRHEAGGAGPPARRPGRAASR